MTKEIRRLFDIPYYQLAHFPQKQAYNAKENGAWVSYSMESVVEQINKMSRGLLALGIKPGDKIAMISNNRPEWSITDYAILQVGAINVPVYSSITEADYEYIFNHAEIKFCFVSDAELLKKVNAIKSSVPCLTTIFTYEKIEGERFWKEVLELGDEKYQPEVESIMETIKSEDLATIIYTSGTTGVPKGVMLSHKNIASNCISSLPRFPLSHGCIALSFLPVAHVYERMLLYLYAFTGTRIFFAESIETIGDNLKEVKPDVFVAVPRLLEKVYDKIVAKGSELTGIKKALFFWSLKLGEQYEVSPPKGALYNFKLAIANKLVFSKWREALGNNVKIVASGSAALQPRLARIFNAAKIPIMEGYGLTETSPTVAVNCEKNDGLRFGTVGRAVDNVEIKIAEDGEILIKGPNVMMGYYKQPELTQKVFNEEGYFLTGDIGELVEGQFLKITDRKKEIFKTSGGKYIAPQLMENKFKESRFIEQIMVIGEGRKHPAALIVPEFSFLKEWAKRKGVSYNSNQDLIKNEQVISRIKQEIDHHNSSFGQWEKIKRFELIPQQWAIETGELTPSLKLKRKFILEKYQEKVDRIYGGE